jgi:hypothetical protein
VGSLRRRCIRSTSQGTAVREEADFPCFTLVDNSFMTDGVSYSISLVTSCHEHEPNPGTPQLYKAGYEVSFRVQQLSTLLERGNGATS